MKNSIYILIFFVVIACKQQPAIDTAYHPYDESEEIAQQQQHEKERMRFKLIQSKFQHEVLWAPFTEDLNAFSETRYQEMAPLVLEKSIPEIQESVRQGVFGYYDLTLFYIYRIKKYESNNNLALHTIIALNPDVLNEARERDNGLKNKSLKHLLYGMPVLLKDNIGATGMPTTAGAAILEENAAPDAFITRRLKDHGALILGKANLSEWAYFFCDGCPLGYSAIGGQNLNPYGRKVFESGGSSSGSGVAVAANYAVAAIGTETAGSILSPSSQNSVVGLKPTVGLLSRTGIVPISSTLDTPGPMTKNITDNAILLSALVGKDGADPASVEMLVHEPADFQTATLKGKKFGVFRSLLENDSIYRKTISNLENAGAEVIPFDPPEASLNGFITLLNIDMKHDLPKYLSTQTSENVTARSVADIIAFNALDSLRRAPYGQKLFEKLVADSTSLVQLDTIKSNLKINGRMFFDVPMDQFGLDAILSINNYHAAFAAVAHYPALTVPMGYKASGEPISLTFIGKPFEEQKLLQLGFAFEKETKIRKQPENYK